ncbi:MULTISPECIES: hypothetical protein, partial [unclassified Pseudoalteromonas]|uniref:hypothetical protein n=1 Tax=unclassified Pseudoalteromonas TaxID=194690 RepID=UPI001C723172
SPSSCFVSLLSSACALGYLLNPRKQKTRHIAVTGFFNLKPGNVVVPTAVESHIANATLSLCRDMSVH